MTEPHRFPAPLTIESFDSYQEPELALVRLREELLARLTWLETALTPTDTKAGQPGDALARRGILSKSALNGIRNVLEAADPAKYGDSVPRSAVAIVVEAGLTTAASLDRLIETTRSKLTQLSDRGRLLYRLAELPSSARWRVASELGLADELGEAVTGTDTARELLRAASDNDQLGALWDAVFDIQPELLTGPNPFKQNTGEPPHGYGS